MVRSARRSSPGTAAYWRAWRPHRGPPPRRRSPSRQDRAARAGRPTISAVAAGKQPPLAIRRNRRHRIAVALHPIHHRHTRRIAPRFRGQLAQPRDAGSQARQRIQQMPCCWTRSDTTHRRTEPHGATMDRSRRRPRSADAVAAPAAAGRSDRKTSCSGRRTSRVPASTARGMPRRYSSVTAPRSANGVVTTASNSAFSQPAPMPIDQPPFGQHVDRRQHLRREHRRPMRHHQHRQHQPDARRLRRDERGRGQQFVPFGRRVRHELARLGIRITRHADVGQHDVIGQRQVIIAHRLAFLREAGEAARGAKSGR